MALKPSAKDQMLENPITHWNKSTVADGYFLNSKTIEPIEKRTLDLA